MDIVYTFKRNHCWVDRRIPPAFLRMLELCQQDLHRFQFTVDVIFQTGISRNHDRYLGLCSLSKTDPCRMTIHLYTYRRPQLLMAKTIAHEFGHVQHYLMHPGSWSWPEKKAEDYANQYADQMMQRFASTFTANS